MIELAIASTSNRLYAGELATLHIRVRLARAAALRLALEMPLLLNAGASTAPGSVAPVLEVADTRYMVWETSRLIAGEHTFTMLVDVAHQREPLDQRGGPLAVIAEAVATLADGGRHLARETLTLFAEPRARWLEHLPSIYRDDEVISQFLMLFESFHRPHDQRIDDMHHYLDPRIMPRDLLPWFAGWADLAMDARLSEARQRQLLRSAIRLYRQRGTTRGVREIIEIYTGVTPDINERRAHNFTLGSQAVLGPGIALGHGNQPHRFEVDLALPALKQPEAEVARRVDLETLIRAEQPAHTTFVLNISTDAIRN